MYRQLHLIVRFIIYPQACTYSMVYCLSISMHTYLHTLTLDHWCLSAFVIFQKGNEYYFAMSNVQTIKTNPILAARKLCAADNSVRLLAVSSHCKPQAIHWQEKFIYTQSFYLKTHILVSANSYRKTPASALLHLHFCTHFPCGTVLTGPTAPFEILQENLMVFSTRQHDLNPASSNYKNMPVHHLGKWSNSVTSRSANKLLAHFTGMLPSLSKRHSP